MKDSNSDVDAALHEVWLRHRGAVLDDLTALIDRMVESQDTPTSTQSITDEIQARVHRLLGSLSMVGLSDQVDVLREIEHSAISSDRTAGDATEAVERLHGLLDRLRATH